LKSGGGEDGVIFLPADGFLAAGPGTFPAGLAGAFLATTLPLEAGFERFLPKGSLIGIGYQLSEIRTHFHYSISFGSLGISRGKNPKTLWLIY
jgi:hypothetical protein